MGSNLKRNWFIYLFLVIITAAVYCRATESRFVHWDDPVYVYENQHVKNGLTMPEIRWALTAKQAANWLPVTWLSLMADHEISARTQGADSKTENPAPYHLTNVIIHVLNTLLLFAVLNVLTGSRWRSAMVAALFAVHPLHVESVAWISERKDVLSTLFMMLTLLAYAWYAKKPGVRRYALMALLFALGLMSKSMLVSLPLVLLLLDFWPLKRVAGWTGDKKVAGISWGKLLLEKTPLLALCAAVSVITVIAQKYCHAVQTLDRYPIGVRLANALVSSVAYLSKMVWPVKLAALYKHPGATLPGWQVLGSGLILALVTAGAIVLRRERPWFTVGWLWYLIMLVPVIGIVQVGPQAMADRYTYTTLIGIFVIIVWGAAELAVRYKVKAPALAVVAALVLVSLSVRAYDQVHVWHDSIALFENSTAVAPCDLADLKLAEAHYNRALDLIKENNNDEAVVHLREATRLDPSDFKGHNNLGAIYLQESRLDEAAAEFETAQRLRPKALKCRSNLGVIYAMQGKKELARRQFESVLKLDPKYTDALDNLRILQSPSK